MKNLHELKATILNTPSVNESNSREYMGTLFIYINNNEEVAKFPVRSEEEANKLELAITKAYYPPYGSLSFELIDDEEQFDESEELLTNKFGVLQKGGAIGEFKGDYLNTRKAKLLYIFNTEEEAKNLAKRRNDARSPGEKNYYKIKYSVVQLTKKDLEAVENFPDQIKASIFK